MTLQFWFWVLYVIGFLVLGVTGWRSRVDPNIAPAPFSYLLPSFLFWILVGLLGWAQFGAPVK